MSEEVHATTSLFYGVFATTESIFLASEIYFKIQPILTFLKIISTRKDKSIIISTNNLMNKVPREIWEMIKLELIKLVKSDVFLQILIRMNQDDCHLTCTRMDGCGNINQSPEFLNQLTSWTCPHTKECVTCEGQISEELDMMLADVNWHHSGLYSSLEKRTKMEDFLFAHDLYFVSKEFVTTYIYSDIDSLTPIGIDQNVIQHISGSSNGNHYSLPVNSIVPLLSTFQLSISPEVIARRFIKFKNDWDLTFGDPNEMWSGTPRGNLAHRKGVAIDIENDKSYYQTPQWYMWTRATD